MDVVHFEVSSTVFEFICSDLRLQIQTLTLKSYLNTGIFGVPVVAQWLTNPTRNHEVVGSVPALAQWVDDPALL